MCIETSIGTRTSTRTRSGTRGAQSRRYASHISHSTVLEAEFAGVMRSMRRGWSQTHSSIMLLTTGDTMLPGQWFWVRSLRIFYCVRPMLKHRAKYSGYGTYRDGLVTAKDQAE